MAFKQLLAREQVRYIIAGGMAFVVEYLIFLLLMQLTNALFVANSISFIVGVLAGFVLHKHWSFSGNHLHRTHAQLAAVFSTAAFNLVFTNIVIGLLVNALSVLPFIAKVITLVLIVLWNYAILSKIVFRRN